MRPYLILFVLVLAVGIGAWWYSSSDRGAQPIESAGPGAAVAQPAAPEARADLEKPTLEQPAAGAHADRSAVAETPLAPAGSKPAAAKSELALTGHVVDGNGNPVAKARVLAAADAGFSNAPLDAESVFRGPGFRPLEATTDAAGAFRLTGVRPGNLHLAVRASGFAPYDRSDVPVPAEVAHDLGTISLQQGVTLSGRVVDARNKPVAGAKVLRILDSNSQTFFFSGGRPGGAVVATTDADGRFQADQMASGDYGLLVTSEEHPDQVQRGRTQRAGEVVSDVWIQLEDGLTIAGRVTGFPPALGARLIVQGWPGQREPSEAERDENTGKPQFVETREAPVAADGSFEVRGLRSGVVYEMAAGTRPGNEPWVDRRSESVKARGGEKGIELAYRPSSTLVFQVLDKKTNQPLTDFEVRAGAPWPMPLRDEKGKSIKQHPNGFVRFSDLRPESDDTKATLSISAVGFQDFQMDDIALVRGGEVDLGQIFLEPTPLLTVTVTDGQSGAPVAGANVTLRLAPESEPGARRVMMAFRAGDTADEGDEPDFGADDQRTGKTDEKGIVRLSSFPGQACLLSVRHSEFAPSQGVKFTAPASGPEERTVALTRGGTVAVTLLDPEGKPVAGGRIGHRAPDEGDEGVMILGGGGEGAITDSHGVARFVHLAPGVHGFRPVISGDQNPGVFSGGDFTFAVAGMPEQQDDSWQEVAVTEGGEHELTLAMPTLYALTGRVREAHESLVGAVLRLSPKRDPSSGPAMPFFGGGPTSRTDGAGMYRFENLKEGDYTLTATHPSRSMPSEFEIRIGGGDKVYDVELPLSIIEGRVTGDDGKPVAGAEVWVERPQGQRPQQSLGFRAVMVTGGGGGNSVTMSDGVDAPRGRTDAEGRYSLRGVHADTDLIVKCEAKGLQPASSPPVRVAADQVRSGVDLALLAAGLVEVVAVGADGGPAANCLITARFQGQGSEQRPRTAFIDDSGKAEIDGLAPGPWKIELRKMSFEPGAKSSPPIPDQTVEVKSKEKHTLQFQVP